MNLIPMDAIILDWVPSPGMVDVGKKIAGLVFLIWILFFLFQVLMPGRSAGRGLRNMSPGLMFGALLAMVILADLNNLPRIVNTIWGWIDSIGILKILGLA